MKILNLEKTFLGLGFITKAELISQFEELLQKYALEKDHRENIEIIASFKENNDVSKHSREA
jgi:hypothetical protein